jgi:gluconate 2-dehydrogenase gamma chain
MLTTWASPKTRTEIVEALDRIDLAAKAAKRMPFAALDAADRDAVLRPHDIEALKQVLAPSDAPKGIPFFATTYTADQGYFKIKDLVLALYYFSEIATSTELVYEHVPGTFEPSILLTPQARPFLGTGGGI